MKKTMANRTTFVSKKELRAYYESYKERLNSLQRDYWKLGELNDKMSAQATKDRILIDELQSQLQTATRIATSAKVAAEQSHKALDDSHKSYLRAYNRGIELQEQLYSANENISALNERIEELKRPWRERIASAVRGWWDGCSKGFRKRRPALQPPREAD